MRKRLTALAAIVALPLVSGGCYTIFHHPARVGALGTQPAEDPRLSGYYPYSPTVWGWYYDHYGPYWSYYAHPWWMSGHHGDHPVPHEDGFAPPPQGSGFDRGGREGSQTTGGFAHPETAAPIAPPDPPRQSTTTSAGASSGGSSGSGDEGPEKPKEEKEPERMGGRGGRR